MGAPTSGLLWNADSLPVEFSSSSAKGYYNLAASYKVPDNTANATSKIRIRSQVSAGYVLIGSISMTRMADDVLVVDGGIRARHILVDSLQAISNIVIARPGGQGAGQDLDVYGQRVYDTNSVRRFQSGYLDI
jgi:hypothetical protein